MKNKEVEGNRTFIYNVLTPVGSNELLFVNGHLYKGHAIHDRYKGFGWEYGRTACVYVDDTVPKDAEVFLVDMSYGRIRKCEYAKEHEVQTTGGDQLCNCWRAIDLPEDQNQ